MTLPVSFGDWIRQRRRALGMTQEDLADHVACSVSAIRKIEQDERRPSTQIAELLAAELQVPAADRALFVLVARGERSIMRLDPATLRPPLPSLVAPASMAPPPAPCPGALPAQVTPFIGREAETEQMLHLLRDPGCRLVTILGPGGSGKTRLSIQVAQRAADDFADGVGFVQLASLTAAALVPEAIAAAIGIERRERSTVAAQVIQYLQRRQMLLVLDNFEHLIEAASWLATLLQETAVKVLVSSRERLNITGEWIFEIRGLPQPPEQAAGDLTGYSAATLFLASVRRTQPGYSVDEGDQQAIIRICRRLEGMPLALELAAPWIRTLTMTEIAVEIERSYEFLTSTARGAPERHRSLRAAFEHSWRLLTPQEQHVLSRLSVFRGGFDRTAAATVAAATLTDLIALMDKSLLRRAGSGRYDLHELVRQFAVTYLGEDSDATHLAHANFYCELARQASAELRGAHQATWYARLEEEHDNLRAALDWTLDHCATALALNFGASLWRFWLKQGGLAEGRRWLTAALERITPDTDETVLIAALHGAGALARAAGDFAAARSYHSRALALRRSQGDASGVAASLNNLAVVDIFEGNYASAEELLLACLEIQRELVNPRGIAMSLLNLGVVQTYTGRYWAAEESCTAAIATYREIGDRHSTAGALGNLGDALRYQGALNRAQSALEDSLMILEEIGDPLGMAVTHNSLGRLWLDGNDVSRAGCHFSTALELAVKFGDPNALVESLEGLAGIAATTAAWERVVTMSAAAAARRQWLQTRPPPVESAALTQQRATAEAVLGTTVFTRLWTAGEYLTEEELLTMRL